jgi:hypothetical protein
MRPEEAGEMRTTPLVLMALLFLPGITPGGPRADAAAAPAFRLCQGNVAEVGLSAAAAGFVVHVRLTEPAARAFAELTGRARGRELTVLAGSEVFSRAVVRTVIDSGRLVSAPRPRAAAGELRRAIGLPRPESECGAVAGDDDPLMLRATATGATFHEMPRRHRPSPG